MASNNDVVFAEFCHTGYGVTCSDSGLMDLSTAEECSGAVNYAKKFNRLAHYVFAVSWSSAPKGCFIADSGHFWFNKHSTGSRDDLRKSICKKGNT